MSSIVSDVIRISKDVQDIERELAKIFGGEVLRWAIIDIFSDSYKVICSYKKK